MANSKKPMRRQSCSTKALDPTLSSERTVARSAIQPLTERRLRKPSFFSTEATLRTQAHTVPITVAMAAPRTPRAGKPNLPPMSR